MRKTNFMKDLIHIKQTDDTITRVISAGLNISIPLLIGYFSGNMQLGTLGALGTFSFLSFTPLPLDKLVKRIIKIGLSIMVGFYLGLLSTLIPWLIPVVLGGVSLCGLFIARLLQIPSPGAFFVIMVTAMSSGMDIPFDEMLPAMLTVGIGVITSVFMAILAGIINNYFQLWTIKTEVPSYSERIQDTIDRNPELLLASLYHAGVICFATYVAQSLGFANPYWITVSTVAVLQGRKLKFIFERNVQRIIGGVIGLFIGMLIFSLNLSLLEKIFILIILNTLVEFCMTRNYGLANFFTNPLAILLSSLSSNLFASDLFTARFIGLVLGSIIGVIGAALFSLGLRMYERELSLIRKNKK